MFVEHRALPCISLLLTTIVLPNRLQSYLNLKYSTYLISTQTKFILAKGQVKLSCISSVLYGEFPMATPLHCSQNHSPLGAGESPTHWKWNHYMGQSLCWQAIMPPQHAENLWAVQKKQKQLRNANRVKKLLSCCCYKVMY